MRHGTCFHRRLSTLHAGAAPHSAVAEFGVVRRRYARCVQRSFSLSFPFTDAIIHLSGLRSSQRQSVPGTSSLSVSRIPFVSWSITHLVLPGVARRFCAQATATGGSLPVPSLGFGRPLAGVLTEAATPNQALERTATRVTVAAIPVRSRLVRARRCLTSVAAFFAPPSQLPRRAPQSLSLGS